MTALYVPPTDEADHKKQNQSLQLIGSKTTDNTTNIATNTANITTNTTNITTLLAKSADFISARDYGAVFDGVTDDTTAIAAAIAATPSGGTLLLPPGRAIVSGSGSQIFTITNPINIVGAGSSINGGVGSTLKLATGVSTTRDLFHIVGITNSALRGYGFADFNVSIVSGTGGQNVFHFDSTAGTTTGFAEVLIHNVMLPDSVSAGGNSVFLNNGIGTNTNGGTFNFTVQHCYLGGGITFLLAGDSLRVLNNIITGANAGLTSNQISGAGGLLFAGNNVTSTAGCVVVHGGIAPIIRDNIFEQTIANTEANNAMLDLTGSGTNVSSAKILSNQIQALVGTATLLRVGAATGTVIDHNRLSTPSAYAHVVNTASATGTVLGLGNTFVGGGANLSDAGAGTVAQAEAWTSYTSTFAASTGTATVVARQKTIGKTVFVNIQTTFTSAVTGTFSVTLPTTSLSNAAISGKEIAIGGLGAAGFVLATASALSVLSAAGTQFTTNGMVIILTGSYESS